jgi:hypothetical protein
MYSQVSTWLYTLTRKLPPAILHILNPLWPQVRSVLCIWNSIHCCNGHCNLTTNWISSHRSYSHIHWLPTSSLDNWSISEKVYKCISPVSALPTYSCTSSRETRHHIITAQCMEWCTLQYTHPVLQTENDCMCVIPCTHNLQSDNKPCYGTIRVPVSKNSVIVNTKIPFCV